MTQWEKCTYSMKCAQTYSCWQTTSLPSVKLPYIHFFVRWLYFRCICRWCTMHSCFRTRAQSAADGCCDGGFVSGLSNRRGTLHYVHCRLGQHIIFNVVLLHWMHRDGTGTRIACAMCIEIELCGNRVLRVDSNSVHGCIHRRTLEQFYLSESIFGMNSLKLGVQTKRMTGRDAGMQWMSCAISYVFFFFLSSLYIHNDGRRRFSFFGFCLCTPIYTLAIWTGAKIFCCDCKLLRSKCSIL